MSTHLQPKPVPHPLTNVRPAGFGDGRDRIRPKNGLIGALSSSSCRDLGPSLLVFGVSPASDSKLGTRLTPRSLRVE